MPFHGAALDPSQKRRRKPEHRCSAKTQPPWYPLPSASTVLPCSPPVTTRRLHQNIIFEIVKRSPHGGEPAARRWSLVDPKQNLESAKRGRSRRSQMRTLSVQALGRAACGAALGASFRVQSVARPASPHPVKVEPREPISRTRTPWLYAGRTILSITAGSLAGAPVLSLRKRRPRPAGVYDRNARTRRQRSKANPVNAAVHAASPM